MRHGGLGAGSPGRRANRRGACRARRVALPRVLVNWVGKSAALAEPMAAFIERQALSAPRIHAGDTPMPMLEPRRDKTQTATVWAYLRGDRPFGGRDPPAVFYEFTSDRKGEHPQIRGCFLAVPGTMQSGTLAPAPRRPSA